MFVDLIGESGLFFQSKNITVVIQRTYFIFKGSSEKKFEYFLKSSSKNLSLEFIGNLINIVSFDYFFYFEKESSPSSVNLRYLFINEKFKGCFLFLNQYQGSILRKKISNLNRFVIKQSKRLISI